MLKVFLCFFVCLQLVYCQFAAEQTCRTMNGRQGICINLKSCQPMLEIIDRNSLPKQIITDMLRQSHCGYDDDDPKTCCPIDGKGNSIDVQTTSLPPLTLPTSTLPSTTIPPKPNINNDDLLLVFGTCTTVYKTPGVCKDWDICEPLMELMKQAYSNPAANETLKKAHCGFKNHIPQVCCPVPGLATSLPPAVTTAQPSPGARIGGRFITLPEPPVCGVINPSVDKVVGGRPAKYGALPWMAVLGYRNISDEEPLTVKWNCGGSLISIRHVLTAAHCVIEDGLYIVRLGELDLTLDFVDDGATPIDILIEEKIKHESYTRNRPTLNDVGILVLQRDVEFTDYIRPICFFVDKELRSQTFENKTPSVAGWGLLKWVTGPASSRYSTGDTANICNSKRTPANGVPTNIPTNPRHAADVLDIVLTRNIQVEVIYDVETQQLPILITLVLTAEFIIPRPAGAKTDWVAYTSEARFLNQLGQFGTLNSVQAAHLQVAQIPVVGDAECENAYKVYVPKNATQFLSQAMCAGNGSIDSCKGDSGGPLMLPMSYKDSTYHFYFEIGVVSFSIKCATAGKPGVYARVTHFMPWIEQIVLGKTIP